MKRELPDNGQKLLREHLSHLLQLGAQWVARDRGRDEPGPDPEDTYRAMIRFAAWTVTHGPATWCADDECRHQEGGGECFTRLQRYVARILVEEGLLSASDEEDHQLALVASCTGYLLSLSATKAAVGKAIAVTVEGFAGGKLKLGAKVLPMPRGAPDALRLRPRGRRERRER